MRGRLVSFNQLNIVIGISVAFFTNYLILQMGQSEAPWAAALKFDAYNWRWMLGVETLPAVLYFFGLFFVPRSPRWLIMKANYEEALSVMTKAHGAEQAASDLEQVRASLKTDDRKEQLPLAELFKPALTLVLTIGVVVAVLQQITGINSVFFYAPMIFEQSGIGTDASFVQAILVGLANLVFTVLAIAFVDKLGRKPLLIYGIGGIAVFMFLLSYGFGKSTYTLSEATLNSLPAEIDREGIASLLDITFDSDLTYKQALGAAIGEDLAKTYESELITAAANINAVLILVSILGFVASFAISIGPVMWVLFSELFPNRIRGLAISFVGLINSAVSFTVQLVFPWELANFGTSLTFLIYGVFAALGLFFILMVVPETKGRSLEELEEMLVKA